MAFKHFRSEPLTEKEKAERRRRLGIVQPRSAAVGPKPIDKPKERDYLAPVDPKFVPCKPRGHSGCRLSHEKRLLILERHEKRAAFFAELGVRV